MSARRAIDDLVTTAPGRAAADALIRYFSATLEDAAHIPREGPALLVGNHGAFGVDAFILGALLAREVGRMPTWLAERQLWRVPGAPRVLDALGAIEGEPVAALRRLEAGELVVVYPGGILDSYKLASERHRLQWGSRAGFARLAMQARAPIVPIAACGGDDIYRVIAREPGLGKLLFGDARYNFPIVLGRRGTLLPRKVRVTMRAHAPVDTAGDPSSPADVERVRAETHEALRRTLEAH